MSYYRISVRERLQAAVRVLFARGDNGTICSFCGRSPILGETIVAGPGVAICASCAYLALDFVAVRGDGAIPNGLFEVGLMPLLEPICLLPSGRMTLEADLTAAAQGVPCQLMGWSYNCNSRGGDYLSVRVACAEDIASEEVHRRFIDTFLSARP